MGLLSKIFGRDTEKQKNEKFKELESTYGSDEKILNNMKSLWLTSRGNHYGANGNYKEALHNFQEAIQINSIHIPAFMGVATVYREVGQLDKALEVLRNAMDIFNKADESYRAFEFDVYNQIASIYFLKNDRVKFLEWAEKAILVSNDQARISQISLAVKSGVIDASSEEESVQILKELVVEVKNGKALV